MKPLIKIDFVSDISCGWCAVGLHSIEQALRNIGSDVTAEFHFQPFELNPDMPSGGENLAEHLRHKYGEQAALQYFSATRQQGADAGFEFNLNGDSRIYNTFDAHRLLHWAGLNGRQAELKHALFDAHFTRNGDPGGHDVLLGCAEAAQLSRVDAMQVLSSDAYSREVREMESEWLRKGVQAVPTIVINDQYIVTGSRSVETFERLIMKVIEADAAPGGTGAASLREGEV